MSDTKKGSPATQPFHEGIAAKRLVLQYDAASGLFQFWPRLLAPRGVETPLWREVSGRGKLFAFTIQPPSVKNGKPVIIAAVDLDEKVRMLAPLRGIASDDVRAGITVMISFPDDPGDAPYIFRPV